MTHCRRIILYAATLVLCANGSRTHGADTAGACDPEKQACESTVFEPGPGADTLIYQGPDHSYLPKGIAPVGELPPGRAPVIDLMRRSEARRAGFSDMRAEAAHKLGVEFGRHFLGLALDGKESYATLRAQKEAAEQGGGGEGDDGSRSPIRRSEWQSGSCSIPHLPSAYKKCLPGADELCAVGLNTTANGTHICIVKFIAENCPGCKKGWRHRCTNGVWRPTEECLPGEKKKAEASLANGASGSNAGGNQAMSSQAAMLAGEHEDAYASKSTGQDSGGDGPPSGRADEVCGRLSPDVSDLSKSLSSYVDISIDPRRYTFSDSLGVCGGSVSACEGQHRSTVELANSFCASNPGDGCRAMKVYVESSSRHLKWLQCHKSNGASG